MRLKKYALIVYAKLTQLFAKVAELCLPLRAF